MFNLHRLRSSIFILLISVLASSAQQTQTATPKPTGKLTGTVVDSDGAVVSNAQIIIDSTAFTLVIAATWEGTFESELPVGYYKVVAVREPLQVSSDTYALISARSTTNLKLKLNKPTLAESIRESHINANVPAESDFDRFLQRDLKEFFKNAGASIVVEYELLRKEPTQSGVAFPKFYAWVVIKSGDKVVEEGAVRIAAIEKKEFEVVNYLMRADIERDTQTLYRLFPTEVADKVKEKLKK